MHHLAAMPCEADKCLRPQDGAPVRKDIKRCGSREVDRSVVVWHNNSRETATDGSRGIRKRYSEHSILFTWHGSVSQDVVQQCRDI